MKTHPNSKLGTLKWKKKLSYATNYAKVRETKYGKYTNGDRWASQISKKKIRNKVWDDVIPK